jgi:hypothetical protein
LDIAKNVFQVHGIDAKEKVVARKQLRRSQMIKIRVCDQPADGQGTWSRGAQLDPIARRPDD